MNISLVNTSLKDSRKVLVSFDSVKAFTKVASARVLTSADVHDFNDFDHPESVKPAEFKDYKFTKAGLEVTLPPCSIVCISGK